MRVVDKNCIACGASSSKGLDALLPNLRKQRQEEFRLRMLAGLLTSNAKRSPQTNCCLGWEWRRLLNSRSTIADFSSMTVDSARHTAVPPRPHGPLPYLRALAFDRPPCLKHPIECGYAKRPVDLQRTSCFWWKPFMFSVGVFLITYRHHVLVIASSSPPASPPPSSSSG